MSDALNKEMKDIDRRCKNYKCPHFEQPRKYNCKIFYDKDPIYYCKNYQMKGNNL